MGGIKKFKVELDERHRSFFPGQSVTGRVVVTSKKDKKIEGNIIK
jgi:hypothetical protein